MFRAVISSIIIITCVAFSAVAWAQKSQDENQVREFMQRMIDAEQNGKTEQILSCWAPDYVAYVARVEKASLYLLRGENLDIIDPEDWLVLMTGPEELRKYAEQYKDMPAQLAAYKVKYPGSDHFVEIRHVSVTGDHAIVVTKHRTILPNTKTLETLNTEQRTVWMLDRIKGNWMVSRAISGITRGQVVTKMFPPLKED